MNPFIPAQYDVPQQERVMADIEPVRTRLDPRPRVKVDIEPERSRGDPHEIYQSDEEPMANNVNNKRVLN